MARSKSWKIRNITIEDVPAINALHNYAIAEGFQEWNVPLSMQYHEDLLGKMLQHGYQGLIAEDDNGKVIAFGLLPAVYWTPGHCNQFCVNYFSVVSPPHRRKGLAMHLWTTLRDHPSNADKKIYRCFSNVLSCNLAAIAFLRSTGFSSDGELDAIAIKNGHRFDHQYWSRFMSDAPSSEGLNFPSPTEVLPSYEPGTHDSPISLRPATLADAKFLTDIYNHYIFNGCALGFTKPVSVEARTQWLEMLLKLGYPCFICSHHDQDIGYASLTPYAESEHANQCFEDTAYVSLYLVPSFTFKGIGSKLLLSLTEHSVVRTGRVKRIISEVIAANGAGMNFAAKMSLVPKVTKRQRLVKFGKFTHVSVFQMNIKAQETTE